MLAFYLLGVAFTLALLGNASPIHEPMERKRLRVVGSCNVKNTVALTFDDGPYEYLTDIVDLLDANNATGTFFLNGDNWRCIYDKASVERVKYAYDHGHQLASHTWSHKDLTRLAAPQIVREMSRVDDAIEKITGAMPAFIRPPYGAYNSLLLNLAASRGQNVTIWDFDSEDSLGASPGSQKSLFDQALQEDPETLLSLEHETYATTAQEVLPHYIDKLKAAGYRMVSVAECVGGKPYIHVGEPSDPDASWTC